jgi:hypothetical protein
MLVTMLWNEFSNTYQDCFEFTSPTDLETYLRHLHIDPQPSDALPNAVMHNGIIPLGFANIVNDDLGIESMRHLGPWIANVATHPDFRRYGIAISLITHLLKQYPTRPMYLWTHTPTLRDFYTSKFNFIHIDTIPNVARHAEIYIMHLC